MPLPPEMADHPALTAGLTEIYSNPKEVGGYLGVIDGGSWIVFVGVYGKSELWTSRDPKGGTIGNPYVFQRDDISSASTVTIPNPVFQFYSPIELKMMGITEKVAARYKKKKKVKTQDGEDMTVYEYSDKQIANRNREKAKRIEKLRGKIDDVRSKAKKDLKSSDPEKMLTALAVMLMDHTFERVGNDESADDGHFGVTGWQKDHITFSKGGATIKYVGKSGVKHVKKVTDSTITKALKDACEAAENETSCIFEWDGGKVSAEKVNAYLKEFDISAKDIRGLHANVEMQDQLKASRKKGGKLPEDPKKREKQLKEEFKEALEVTAEAVGHEPATLKSQYLVPGLEDTYLKDGTVMDKLHEKAASLKQGCESCSCHGKPEEHDQSERILARFMSKYKEASYYDDNSDSWVDPGTMSKDLDKWLDNLLQLTQRANQELRGQGTPGKAFVQLTDAIGERQHTKWFQFFFKGTRYAREVTAEMVPQDMSDPKMAQALDHWLDNLERRIKAADAEIRREAPSDKMYDLLDAMKGYESEKWFAYYFLRPVSFR
jgi:DNA topoisomerase IB